MEKRIPNSNSGHLIYNKRTVIANYEEINPKQNEFDEPQILNYTDYEILQTYQLQKLENSYLVHLFLKLNRNLKIPRSDVKVKVKFFMR